MARHTENTGFICLNCTKSIEKLTNGCYRNHCPFCLYSLHVDNHPGDRANGCQGLMEPIGLIYKAKKGWQIVHCCLKCGKKAVTQLQPAEAGRLISRLEVGVTLKRYS